MEELSFLRPKVIVMECEFKDRHTKRAPTSLLKQIINSVIVIIEGNVRILDVARICLLWIYPDKKLL